MLTRILAFLKEQLEESRRHELELKKCPNCENFAELLRLKQFECDRLVDKLNLVNPVSEPVSSEPVNLANEPIQFKSNRVRSAMASRDSFRRVDNARKEFEAMRKTEELNKMASDEIIVDN